MRQILLLTSVLLAAASAPAAPPPAPYGALPNQAQVAWDDLEMYAFIHFTTNTFTGKEWGYGDESPSIFNPTAFDPDQIVGTLAEAGFKGVILTCKHHDGFCLWPTKTTKHNVSASSWKNGQGDVVRDISQACQRHKVGFGTYLSPWDRNNPNYGTPEYVKCYREQLRELLTNYGPVFEVWHDGANGGDGFYGGKRESRSIDRTTYYGWPETWAMVRKLQPRAVVFSDVGPDLRWVGNEGGHAPYPNWATFSPVGLKGDTPAPGYCKSQDGQPDGKHWMPAEVDVSIRPGWFWHEDQNSKVRTPQNLLDLYFASVGHGSSFLLNVPPDRRGLIHENDVAALQGFKKLLDRLYARNLAEGATASANATRGAGFEAARLLDGDKKTYWAAPDEARQAELTVTLPEPRTFSVLRLREPIWLGQRVRKFAVEVREKGGDWKEWFAQGSSIGPGVLVRGPAVTAEAVRVRLTEAAACPCLSEFSLWLEPANPKTPAITRDREGSVTVAAGPALDVRYTLDGSDPTASSPRYEKPFALPEGGTVKARSFSGSESSSVATAVFGLASAGWKVSTSFETGDHPAAHALDGDPRTIWCTHDTVMAAPYVTSA